MILEGNLLILLLAKYVRPCIIDGQFENLARAHHTYFLEWTMKTNDYDNGGE